MEDGTRRTRHVQRGPRSQRVVEAVREATLAELARCGYAGLSIESVAAAAGVHRTTIYRRWPTKADLVAGLVEAPLERLVTTQRADTLRDSLRALTLRLVANLREPEGLALIRVLTADLDELRAVVDGAGERARGAFRQAFEDAAARGEIDDDVDTDALVHLLFGGVLLWTRGRGHALDEEVADRLIAPIVRVATRGV